MILYILYFQWIRPLAVIQIVGFQFLLVPFNAIRIVGGYHFLEVGRCMRKEPGAGCVRSHVHKRIFTEGLGDGLAEGDELAVRVVFVADIVWGPSVVPPDGVASLLGMEITISCSKSWRERTLIHMLALPGQL